MTQSDKNTYTQLAPKGKKLRIYSAKDLLAKHFPSRPWVIENFLKARQAAMIYSPTGAGKSWFSLSLACVAAGGGQFHNFQSESPRKVIYIDGEMDLEDIQERLGKCVVAVKADPKAVGENLQIISRQAQTAGTTFFDLNDAGSQSNLLSIAKQEGAALVILDNFSTLVEVDDENSATAFNKITTFLLTMKQAGIATLLVHHANKAKTGFRGSQKLSVTFDMIAQLYRPEDASHRGCTIEIDFEKNRHSINAEPVRLFLGVDATHWEVHETEQGLVKLAKMLRSLNFTSQKALAEAYGCSKGQISKLIQRAEAKGILGKDEWKGLFVSARNAQEFSADFNDFLEDSDECASLEF